MRAHEVSVRGGRAPLAEPPARGLAGAAEVRQRWRPIRHHHRTSAGVCGFEGSGRGPAPRATLLQLLAARPRLGWAAAAALGAAGRRGRRRWRCCCCCCCCRRCCGGGDSARSAARAVAGRAARVARQDGGADAAAKAATVAAAATGGGPDSSTRLRMKAASTRTHMRAHSTHASCRTTRIHAHRQADATRAPTRTRARTHGAARLRLRPAASSP